MVYVLAFFLVLIAKMAFGKKQISTLKFKKYLKLNFVCKGVFFSKKNLLYNKESKEYLKKFGLKRAKKVDEILLKIRMNYIDVSKLSFEMPSYFVDKTDAQNITELLYVKTIEKILYYSNLKFDCKDIFYCSNKSDLQKLNLLNVNKEISFLSIFDSETDLYFDVVLKKSIECGNCYLLERYENENTLILKYKFKLNNHFDFIKIINKKKCDNNFILNYFFNLEKNKYNYFKFKIAQNFISYKNLITNNINYLNFNNQFNSCFFSKIKNLKLSNKPCINLSYNIFLKPNETKKLLFCNSDQVYNLQNIKIENLYKNALKRMNTFFKFNFEFKNKTYNEHFLRNFKNAKVEYLFDNEPKFVNQLSFEELIKCCENQSITALDFYYSVVNNIIKKFDSGVEINAEFVSCDFIILFEYLKKQKRIEVKKFCASTTLVIDDIRFSSSKILSFASLSLHDNFLLETN